jgi:hypothetical protein
LKRNGLLIVGPVIDPPSGKVNSDWFYVNFVPSVTPSIVPGDYGFPSPVYRKGLDAVLAFLENELKVGTERIRVALEIRPNDAYGFAEAFTLDDDLATKLKLRI